MADKKQMVDWEKANYLMATANTLILTGSIFLLAFITALVFLEDPELESVTFFLAGTLTIGFLGIVSGFEKFFLSMKYATGLKKSMSLTRAELMYGAFGLFMALLFITALGLEDHNDVLPFVGGIVMALLIVFFPRQIVLNEKLVQWKRNYFKVAVIASLILSVLLIALYLITGIYYIDLTYGHLISMVILGILTIFISKYLKFNFTKRDAFGLAIVVLMISILFLIVNWYLIAEFLDYSIPVDYVEDSIIEDIVSAVIVFAMFFVVFSIEEEE